MALHSNSEFQWHFSKKPGQSNAKFARKNSWRLFAGRWKIAQRRKIAQLKKEMGTLPTDVDFKRKR